MVSVVAGAPSLGHACTIRPSGGTCECRRVRVFLLSCSILLLSACSTSVRLQAPGTAWEKGDVQLTSGELCLQKVVCRRPNRDQR